MEYNQLKMVNCDLKKNRNKESCKRQAGEARFEILLPKRDNSGRKINVNRYKKYIGNFNNNFGGSTLIPSSLGCWIDKERNKIQCEEGFILTAFRDFDSDPRLKKLNFSQRRRKLDSDFKKVKELARKAGREFGQAEIAVIYDNINNADLVKGKWMEKINDRKIKENLFEKNL